MHLGSNIILSEKSHINVSDILQSRMCHLQQCNFDYQNIFNFHRVFLRFILMGLSVLGKEIKTKLHALISKVVSVHTTM